MLMPAVFTSRKVRSLKKEINSLIEDPVSVAEQVDQFLGPNFYSWMEMMYIIDMLFIGEEGGGQLCKCGKGMQRAGWALEGGRERKDLEDKLY